MVGIWLLVVFGVVVLLEKLQKLVKKNEKYY
jgi:hypothetical protein